MYGTSAATSYGAVAFAVLLVVALAFLASPLIALIVAVVAAPVLLVAMAAMRRRSAERDQVESEPGGRTAAEDQGDISEPARGRSGGAPVSGEG
jgi:membrane protein implicated in regulation of membrane protease activity